MVLLKIGLLALIGAMIGWLTNIIAIKLIFRPLNPVNIPVINMKIQGLIPKRKGEIAASVGKTVEEELISINDIIDKVIENENISSIIFMIKRKVNKIVDEKLPAIIPGALKNIIFSYIDDAINNHGERVLKDLAEDMVHKATTQVKISKIIEDKINAFELEKVENIILSIAKKELKHIEILGGILGFIIGIIQGIITIFL
jgi:uncharacterized membrane protein YheB (UPF0754 family)